MLTPDPDSRRTLVRERQSQLRADFGRPRRRSLRLPSPALVVALVALFVALSGTAVAAGVVPLAKRSLKADNALKLQGRTAAQLAALPGPASSAAGLVRTKTATLAIAAEQGQNATIACDSGKIVSGGFDANVAVLAIESRPLSDSTWSFYLVNASDGRQADVTLYAVCLG
jgi:hypothetical protein